jgi:hypothetical protein
MPRAKKRLGDNREPQELGPEWLRWATETIIADFRRTGRLTVRETIRQRSRLGAIIAAAQARARLEEERND